MIFFNGANGGLGRYFGEAAKATGRPTTALLSRIEDLQGFRAELTASLGAEREASLFLLAAKVSVPWCESHPDSTHQTNVVDTEALVRTYLEFCAERQVAAKIIYVSSAHLYARHDGSIHETDPVGPRSVYARSKYEAEIALRKLANDRGADLRIARVFGLVAPGQPANYILPALIRRAQELNFSGVPGLSNLRDYLDSRDVCRSLIAIEFAPQDRFLRVCPEGLVNVASGEGRSIRSVLEACIEAVHGKDGLAKYAPQISEAPPRADDVPRIVASLDRYLALTGRLPRTIPLSQTIRDSLAT